MLKKTLFLLTLIFCLISFLNTSYSKKDTTTPETVSKTKKIEKKADTASKAKTSVKDSLSQKLDRLGKKIDQMNKRSLEVKNLTKSKHAITFAKYWGYPLYYRDHNDKWKLNRHNNDKKTYSGLSVSSTNTDGLWRFGTTFLVSNTQEISSTSQILPDPDDLSSELVEIETTTKIVEWIITPNLSLPIFKRKFWKNRPFASDLELRLGVAYEMHFSMEYQKNEISVLYIEKKTIIFPTDFSNRADFTGIGTLDFNIRALHFEVNLSANKNQVRLGFGLGAKW